MRRKGFSLVEGLLAIAAFSIFVTGLITVFVYGRQGSALTLRHSQAESLAHEGIAAVRSIRDRNFASLAPGTYGLSLVSNQWQLTATPDTTDGLTRTVVISSPEANIRQAVVTIGWQQTLQRTGSFSLSTYVSNWRTAVVPPTSWSTPVQQSLVDLSGSQNGLKVAAQGNYVYLVRPSATPDFAIIDVTNPGSPSLVGSLSLAGSPTNIFVSGNTAYVTSDDNAAELVIINVTNPAAPSITGTLDLTGGADGKGVWVTGTTAYVTRASSSSNEFQVVNLTTPAAPVAQGSLDLGGDANEVTVAGSFAYVATSADSRELSIINISNPLLPTITADIDATGNNNALTVVHYGTTAIIGRDNGQIHLYNVATPASPVQVGSYNNSDSINDLSIDTTRHYLFVASSLNTAEFVVLNITTPSAPTLLSSLNLATRLQGIAFESVKDRAYGASEGDGNELLIWRPGP